jgi:hypothetical protein
MNNLRRAQLALNRIVAVVGDEHESMKIWNAGITAHRMDLVADQGEKLADLVEWLAEIEAQSADHADLLETQECARC